MTRPQIPISPYKRGADQGFMFGLYLCAMFLSWVFAATYPALAFATFILAACVPLYTFRALRSTVVAEYGTTPVVSLWVQGITMMACGALICAALILVWFKWIDPQFVASQLQSLVDVYNETNDPSLADTARIASLLLEKNAIPPPSTWMLAFWLFTVFTGSLLSCLMAVLARAMRIKKA